MSVSTADLGTPGTGNNENLPRPAQGFRRRRTEASLFAADLPTNASANIRRVFSCEAFSSSIRRSSASALAASASA